MLIANGVCRNCRADYQCQLSGAWTLSTPKEYNDREYCPECKEAIVKALSKIKHKFREEWIPQGDMPEVPQMNIGQLLEIERGQMFRRVFPSLFNPRTGESEQVGEVRWGGFTYRYSYWESHPPSWDYQATEDNCQG